MKINITHLYPDFLNLYGDRGNIAALKARCLWRGIEAEVFQVQGDEMPNLEETDILFLGGGSDREQTIVCNKLLKIKDDIKKYVENNGVIVAVCGGYQLLGNFYQLEDQKIQGLEILDIDTTVGDKRLIGNVAIECSIDDKKFDVVGFENHGGRTTIKEHTPLGKVISGFGNNGEDAYEGVLYKNVFATYLHGPLLPKNPVLTDIILTRTLKNKYAEFENLENLEDDFENIAREEVYNRIVKK